MKLTILSAIVTGALALDPAEKFYWKRDNSSAIANIPSGGITGTGALLPGSSATPDLTTLVIATTIVETVTKCKPTVVSCPVDSGGMSSLPPDAVYTDYVSSTIVLTSTVCPVSEVAQISSSIFSSISEANLGVPTGGEITATQSFSPIDTATSDVANGGGGTTDGYLGGNGGGGTP
ncbi:MAG: hypothetical protein MI724_18580, partial [Spirochaetales bacterium]|nr:hypothetical protein [Spirochaetales bacterium]